jgi:glycosyltransferase involved in cell wall biosynthesis
VLEKLNEETEVVCINDGSQDNTLDKLLEQKEKHQNLRIIDLSRNFGKEAALSAGIDHAKGDAIIPMDTDLQDPPELLVDMVARWREGYEVVLARRIDRSTDSFAKRHSASMFYKIHNRISDTKIPVNVGDYRLMDRQVVNAVRQLPERRRFMKGLFSWVGFKTTCLDYARTPRVSGTSKFSGWRLWNYAIEGITSFSIAPLKFWIYIGSFLALVSFLTALFIIIRTLIFGVVTPGYASLITVVLFMGGVQLIGIGLLGEYVGRIYIESKQRPVYIVRKEY